MPITIICGTAKAERRRERLLAYFGGTRLVEEWNGNPDVLKEGDIALTARSRFIVPAGAQVITIAAAKVMLTERRP